MTLRATIDPGLSVRVIGSRELRYSQPERRGPGVVWDGFTPSLGPEVERDGFNPSLGMDRPEHVRAASGLAFTGGRLAVLQDDCAFIAMVAGDEVASLVLPRGIGGRRRFEVGLGNKHEKLDLECCIAIGDELFAFGSGSTPMRERVVHVGYSTKLVDAAPLYARLREEVGGAINIEGIAIVAAKPEPNSKPRIPTGPHNSAFSGAVSLWPDVEDEIDGGSEIWLFHRGNTGPRDQGPAIVRFAKTPLLRWLLGNGPVPDARSVGRIDLGEVDGVRFGFTDAIGVGERAFYIAAAEDSPNAVDDGRVLGSQIGVIHGAQVRATALVVDGAPIKAEGLAFVPGHPERAWIAVDPDDVDVPARLYEIELVGSW
jgi:hypothetical protein